VSELIASIEKYLQDHTNERTWTTTTDSIRRQAWRQRGQAASARPPARSQSLEELTQQVAAPSCGEGERGEKVGVTRCLDVGLGGPPGLSLGDFTFAFWRGQLAE
jgi:hypothetical protein